MILLFIASVLADYIQVYEEGKSDNNYLTLSSDNDHFTVGPKDKASKFKRGASSLGPQYFKLSLDDGREVGIDNPEHLCLKTIRNQDKFMFIYDKNGTLLLQNNGKCIYKGEGSGPWFYSGSCEKASERSNFIISSSTGGKREYKVFEAGTKEPGNNPEDPVVDAVNGQRELTITQLTTLFTPYKDRVGRPNDNAKLGQEWMARRFLVINGL